MTLQPTIAQETAPAPTDREAALETFRARLADLLPAERIVEDRLRRVALGTDASFYRLVPEIVAIVEEEPEVAAICAAAHETGVPVTFRAGGTSLSGQSVTDSVLVKLGQDGWRQWEVLDQGTRIRLGPGLTGAQANARLRRFNRKIGPDPASINAAQIGGIAANNASGMCCGTAQNSYRTVESVRAVMSDGTVLDTADEASRAAFRKSHAGLLDGLSALAGRVRADGTLRERIRRKFSIKNTTGYSLNALVDFEDPLDILMHLLIGSEGTLAFLSEITYRTVPDPRDKASALAFFADIETACRAVARLRTAPVTAVEIMDRASLAAVEGKPGMPDLADLGPEAAALLIEVRGDDPDALSDNIAEAEAAIGPETLRPVDFARDARRQAEYWAIRKGAFPSVGAVRETGTTVIIEDVAVATDRLAEAVTDLQRLFAGHGYPEAVIFGHALEGNVHFVFTQGFEEEAEVRRYARFMDAVAELIVGKYDGSLKAEHSTGRNMAPYVEMEWGAEAAGLMREIKRLFDPCGVLNPGVILNDDPEIHLKNLKRMAAADPRVDACIECGFCEPTCPSRAYTTTPRQRIVAMREIARAREDGEDTTELEQGFAFEAVESCAGDGLCALGCPVEINTGDAMKAARGQALSPRGHRIAGLLARNFATVATLTRLGLGAGGLAERVVGAPALGRVTGWLNRMSGRRLPLWPAAMPRASGRVRPEAAPHEADETPRIVYFPSCAARTMAPSRAEPDDRPLHETVVSLMEKAGYRVVYPEGLEGHCCGMPFESKGAFEPADAMRDRLEEAVWAASREGRDPVVFDTSPCVQRVRAKMGARIRPLDITEAVHDLVLDRVDISPESGPVALHVTCSARRMGLGDKLRAVVARCGREPVEPEGVECCGWAGDKGFFVPGLNASALRTVADALPGEAAEGVSTSRTCEIGLSSHGGRPYRSVAYLVDRVARARR